MKDRIDMKKPNLLQRIWKAIFPDHKTTRRTIIKFLQALKKIVESPTASAAVKLTKFDLDDKWLAFMRKWLPVVLNDMLLSDDTYNTTHALKSAINSLRKDSKVIRGKSLNEIGAKLYTLHRGIDPDKFIHQAKIDIEQEYLTMKGEGALS